ncbi:hypothetical protein D3C81_1490910 [compost metagenome]
MANPASRITKASVTDRPTRLLPSTAGRCNDRSIRANAHRYATPDHISVRVNNTVTIPVCRSGSTARMASPSRKRPRSAQPIIRLARRMVSDPRARTTSLERDTLLIFVIRRFGHTSARMAFCVSYRNASACPGSDACRCWKHAAATRYDALSSGRTYTSWCRLRRAGAARASVHRRIPQRRRTIITGTMRDAARSASKCIVSVACRTWVSRGGSPKVSGSPLPRRRNPAQCCLDIVSAIPRRVENSPFNHRNAHAN